jgi:putative transposase
LAILRRSARSFVAADSAQWSPKRAARGTERSGISRVAEKLVVAGRIQFSVEVLHTTEMNKNTTHRNQTDVIDTVLQLLLDNDQGALAEGFRLMVNEAMKAERNYALNAAPYERTDQRMGYANGFKPKTVATRLGSLTFEVPQVRGEIDFYPAALGKGLRSERALKLAIAEMYLQGVSTRKVTAVLEKMCGLQITSSDVSRATAELDVILEQWRERPIGLMRYLILDARYEKVRHNGAVVSCAVLIAIGVDERGKRSVLGVSCQLSEAEVHWRGFLESLQNRGLHGVQLIVSDHHAGLKAACAARFPSVPWQRCQFHLQRNAQAMIAKLDQRAEVAADLRQIFNSLERSEAEARLKLIAQKWQKAAPKLSAWLEANVPEALTVFAFPESHRRRLRTTNGLERLNEELKRRTRVALIFPNEAALERLVTALLMEQSEQWETNKTYLAMET